jgi:hypothetical protein
MKIVLRCLSIALLAVGLSLSANASQIKYAASLSSANEPSLLVPSSAFGFATVVLDDVLNTLDVEVSFSGLTSNAAASHIHCCAPLGTNAAVRVAFGNFPAVTTGDYHPALFTLGSTVGGLPLADFLSGLNSGLAYVNIHTANNPGGEIRGQLALVPVPEPATLTIFGLGLAGFGWMKRRRVTR